MSPEAKALIAEARGAIKHGVSDVRVIDLQARLGALCDLAEKQAQEIETLKGAMSADDARLKTAGERVWGEHIWGCDTAEQLAEAVLELRAKLEKQARVVEALRLYLAFDCDMDYVRAALAALDEGGNPTA